MDRIMTSSLPIVHVSICIPKFINFSEKRLTPYKHWGEVEYAIRIYGYEQFR